AVFRLREHMRRLADSATIHRMAIPYSLDDPDAAAMETIAERGLEACYLRPPACRGVGPSGANPPHHPVATLSRVADWGAYLGAEALMEGVDVGVASLNRMAPNTHPALAKAGGNYLNASLVKMDPVLNGYVEGIMLSRDGYVAEGSGEKLFVVRDGKIYTAPTSLSILPGITRDAVITIARDRGYDVIETQLPREALYILDELFFTGTAAEVTPIKSVDKYKIGKGRRGPVTEELQNAFFDIVQKGNDSHGW